MCCTHLTTPTSKDVRSANSTDSVRKKDTKWHTVEQCQEQSPSFGIIDALPSVAPFGSRFDKRLERFRKYLTGLFRRGQKYTTRIPSRLCYLLLFREQRLECVPRFVVDRWRMDRNTSCGICEAETFSGDRRCLAALSSPHLLTDLLFCNQSHSIVHCVACILRIRCDVIPDSDFGALSEKSSQFKAERRRVTVAPTYSHILFVLWRFCFRRNVKGNMDATPRLEDAVPAAAAKPSSTSSLLGAPCARADAPTRLESSENTLNSLEEASKTGDTTAICNILQLVRRQYSQEDRRLWKPDVVRRLWIYAVKALGDATVSEVSKANAKQICAPNSRRNAAASTLTEVGPMRV